MVRGTPSGARRLRAAALRLAVLLAVLVARPAPGSPSGASRHVSVALLSEQSSVQPGRSFHLGLRMRIARGWHTYWKNPGDSGIPLKVTWELPAGFSAGPIEWPAPGRFTSNSLVSYGYSGEVLLPVGIAPPARLNADSVTIAGRFEWLECSEVCVPGSAVLSLTLPVRPGAPVAGPAAGAFAKARAGLPAAPAGWTFAAESGPRAVSLRFHPPSGIVPKRGYLFVDRPLVADHSAPQGFERVEGGYRITLPPAPNAPDSLGRLTGVLVLEGAAGARRVAVEVDVPASRGDPAPAAVPSEGPSRPVWVAAWVAGAVGLVLLLRLLRRLRASGMTQPPD